MSHQYPQFECTHESDVVHEFCTYVWLPVHTALDDLYGEQWTRHTECLDSLKGSIGVGTKGNIRYDMLIRTAPTYSASPNKPIAVIEFKKPRNIRYTDFKKALLDYPSTPKQIQTLKDDADDEANETLLRDNALPYMKQISTYAATSASPHVILSNWDDMLVFNFHQLHQPNGSTAGEVAQLVWVSESKNETPQVNSSKFLKVLLGSLLRAFEDAKLQVRPHSA